MHESKANDAAEVAQATRGPLFYLPTEAGEWLHPICFSEVEGSYGLLDGCRHALSDSLAHARSRQSPLPVRGGFRHSSSFANLQNLPHLAG